MNTVELLRLADVDVRVPPGELDRRVSLSDVELVGRLGCPVSQAPEQVLQRRGHEEDQERL